MNIIDRVLIAKGWSNDEKYCITDQENNKYLLRVSPIEDYEKRKAQYERIKLVSTLDLPMSKPYEFGKNEEGAYMILGWIDGNDAKSIIPTLSNSQQYKYGLDAGRILKKMHSIPAPSTQENWEIRFNQKIDRKMNTYLQFTLLTKHTNKRMLQMLK